MNNGDQSWLPPNQMPTTSFQLTGERSPSPEALDEADWRLTIDGLVDNPLCLSLEDVRTLSVHALETDIHCVTGWSYRGMKFRGFPLSELLERAGVRAEARFVWFGAHSLRNHDTSLPLALASEDTWLVTEAQNKPLEIAHGGPLRSITPSRYLYKSLKWLHKITLLKEDRLGFWERISKYHNNGDPWPGDQRYETGSMRTAQIKRFLESTDLGRYRDRVLVSVDLSGWQPKTSDLTRLQLKNCNLNGASLQEVDLRQANLSNSSLRGANMARCDLRGADLEGTDFVGADLSGADLRDTILTAARFYETSDTEQTEGARVTGMRVSGATGLFQEQRAYLESHGAKT